MAKCKNINWNETIEQILKSSKENPKTIHVLVNMLDKKLVERDGFIPGAFAEEFYQELDKIIAKDFSEADKKRLDFLLDKLNYKDSTDIFTSSNLNTEERFELLNLLAKGQTRSLQDSTETRKVQRILLNVEDKNQATFEDALGLLERRLEKAKLTGDTQKIERLEKAIGDLKQAEQKTESYRINWQTIVEAQNQKTNLAAERSLLSLILGFGDTKTMSKRQKLLPDFTEKVDKLKKLQEELESLDETSDSYTKDVKKLEKEIKKVSEEIESIRKKYKETESKETKERRLKLEKRILDIDLELQKIERNGSNLYFKDILASAMIVGPDSSITTSLRDLKQRAERIKERVKFVETYVNNLDDDYKFSRPEVERLLKAQMEFIAGSIRNAFEVSNPDKEASNEVATEQKESITKDEMKKLVQEWKTLYQEDLYDPLQGLEEQRMLEDLLESSADSKPTIFQVNPDDVQPATRTTEQSSTITVGKQYDAKNPTDRLELIQDLTGVMGRLSTLSGLRAFNGSLPEWALISALGNNAQSLYKLFKNAVEDPRETNNQRPLADYSDENAKKTFLITAMRNLGYTEEQIAAMPENDHNVFLAGMSNIVSISYHITKSGKLRSVHFALLNQGKIERTIDFISENGQEFNQTEAQQVLTLIEQFQNNGNKVTGYNIIGQGKVIEKLAIASQDIRLAMRVALRSFDTAQLALQGNQENNFTSQFLPGLSGLTKVYYRDPVDFKTDQDISILESQNNVDVIKLEMQARAIANGTVLYGMFAKSAQTLLVENPKATSDGQAAFPVKIGQVVPIWYHSNNPEVESNKHFRGAEAIYNIQPFQNFRDLTGHNLYKETTYNLADVQSITLNLLVAALRETNPDEVNNILSGLVASPEKIDKHYDLVLKLSQRDWEGYIVVKRELRSQQNNKFMLRQYKQNGKLLFEGTTDSLDYTRHAIAEFKNTITRAYNRNLARSLKRYAILVDFREIEANEDVDIYIEKLFKHVNKVFNKRDVSFDSYGNGEFDYISAEQLGRGFAQDVLGFVQEGNTLTERIDKPLEVSQQTKEELNSQGRTMDTEAIEGNISAAAYMPLTPTNVSYFSPLSRFEQERVRNDFTLRKRYKHILNKESLTDEDRKAFYKWLSENKDEEYTTRILQQKAILRRLKDAIAKETNVEEQTKLKAELKTAQEEFSKLTKEYDAFKETRQDEWLDQGRVQKYFLMNPANNRDLYTTPPTFQEAMEMSLEIALDIPQYIATFVHDSENREKGSRVYLKDPLYLKAEGLSAGRGVARTSLAGVHTLLAHFLVNPAKFNRTVKKENGQTSIETIDITPELITRSLEEGSAYIQDMLSKGKDPYNESTYYDDSFSGIHHLVAIEQAYFPKESNFTELLLQIREGKPGLPGAMVVTKKQLTDYYVKTADTFIELLNNGTIHKAINDPKFKSNNREADLNALELLKEGLQSPETREFFKGAVIPVIYSGGYKAVVQGLRGKRDKIRGKDSNDPIGKLSDRHIEVIAGVLCNHVGITNGRLIDQILGLSTELIPDPSDNTKSITRMEAIRKLILTQSTGPDGQNIFVTPYKLKFSQLIEANSRFSDDNLVNTEVLRQAIQTRIEYVADLSLKPVDIATFAKQNKVSTEIARETLKKQMIDKIYAKWNGRIEKAYQLISEYNQREGTDAKGYRLGGELERSVNVALAGGEKQFNQQASLLFLNLAQSTGYKLNDSDEAILEAMMKTGRYISPDDIMFNNYVVFHAMGYGIGTDRAFYPANYSTNLGQGSLSKGYRLVKKDDGSIDWKETLLNSMWSITKNPLSQMSREDATKYIEDLAIKTYSLHAANGYAPTFLGYDKETESSESFFREWLDRSQTERKNNNITKLGRNSFLREQYRDLYKRQQQELGIPADKIRNLTDDEIDSEIESNSIPFYQREGTRILALPGVNEDDVLTPGHDARGLSAFIPRIADHDFIDMQVHGLYSIHTQVKKRRNNLQRGKLKTTDISGKGPSLEEHLSEAQGIGASNYDPKLLPYIPETSMGTPELFYDSEPTIVQKVQKMKYVLTRFAHENNLTYLVDRKDFARLYQIYKINRQLSIFSSRLNSSDPAAISEVRLRTAHRNFILDLWKLSDYQRNAANAQRRLLEIKSAISIDPRKFKYENGSTMQWFDILVTLAEMGVNELSTIKFGVAPTEMLMTGLDPNEVVDVLKNSGASLKPLMVQGRDVAQLILSVFSNVEIKKEATAFINEAIKNNRLTETQIKQLEFESGPKGEGKFVNLSSVPVEFSKEIISKVLSNETLIDSAISNLNLYLSVNMLTGDGAVVLEQAVMHPPTDGTFIVPIPGLGDVTVNRTIQGANEAKFLMTPEAIKRLLRASTNHVFFERIETAIALNKYMSGTSNVQTLKSQGFFDFYGSYMQRIAEETEILEHLEGSDKLKKIVKQGESSLRDELGLTLNPYDAMHYFLEDGNEAGNIVVEYNGKTPYTEVISLPVRNAMEKARLYPALQDQFNILKKFYEKTDSKQYKPVMYLVYLMQNVQELSREQYKILVEEAMGLTSITEEEFNTIFDNATEIISTTDYINYSLLKGKNPYLASALKALNNEEASVDSLVPSNIPDLVVNRPKLIKNANQFSDVNTDFTLSSETIGNKNDTELKRQAIAEAKELFKFNSTRAPLYPSISNEDVLDMVHDPASMIDALGADGQRINSEIDAMVTNKVISEQVAEFYKYLVLQVLRKSPNLTQYLSIKVEDRPFSEMLGSAVKEGDKFVIKINSSIAKNLGTVDQVRVFSHEIAHIARLAFIEDNSLEWRRIESLVRSARGKQTIEVMLLAINNNKKYIGFDKDVAYFRDNPEEFLAQWGGWLLFQKTFDNAGIQKILSRDRGATAITTAWRKAMYSVNRELTGIAVGLDGIDRFVLEDIMGVVDNLFAFSSSVSRQIQIKNRDRELFMIGSFDSGITATELTELAKLEASPPTTDIERDRLRVLQNKYAMYNIGGITQTEYLKLREAREALQDTPVEGLDPGSPHIPFNELNALQRKEIVQTFITNVTQKLQQSRSNTTLGGLSRNLAEKYFGPETVKRILNSRSFIAHFGMTGSRKTHDTNNAIIASLMHVIGDTFDLHQHQFQGLGSAAGIRENKLYSKQWIESVVSKTDKLALESSSQEEYELLRSYAFAKALGLTTLPDISVITNNKAKDLAEDLVITFKQNAYQIKQMLFGKASKFKETLPTTFNTKLIGGTGASVSKKVKKAQHQNRKDLITELTKIVERNIKEQGRVDANVLFITGVLPRITNNTETSVVINEMNRVLTKFPELIDFLKNAIIRELVTNSSTAYTVSKAKSMVDVAFANNFSLSTSYEFSNIDFIPFIRRAVDAVYREANNTKLFKEMFIRDSKKIFTDSDNLVLQAAAVKTLKNRVDTNTAPLLFSVKTDSTLETDLPFGVTRTVDNSVFFTREIDPTTGQEENSLRQYGTNSEVIASLFAAKLGENTEFLSNRSIVSGRDIHSDPVIRKFGDTQLHVHLWDLERRQGFAAISKHSIYEMTGIAGYTIHQLIAMIRSEINQFSDSQEIKESLDVIEEKLRLEQGLGLEHETTLSIYKWMLKYGPDITRLTYGGNLNFASLMMEGALGAYVSTFYGGNVFQFGWTVVKSFLGTYTGKHMTRMEQKGVAVNLMMGLERAMQDSRQASSIAETIYDKNASKLTKFRNWIRQNHNRGYQAVIAGLTQQAQKIYIKGLQAKDIEKLQDIFESGTITDIGQLRKQMKEKKVKVLNAHEAIELKNAGLLDKDVTKAFKWMLKNIKSPTLRDGTVDLQAALEWIERVNWRDQDELDHLGVDFDRITAYKTTAAVYSWIKNFREIVTVDPNAFDSVTGKGIIGLLAFYKQYPHLFLSQKVARMSTKMHWGHQLGYLIIVAIVDLIYNLLLMVALGALPLQALYDPKHKDFIWTNKKATVLRLASRNPVFGALGNTAGELTTSLIDALNRTKETPFRGDPDRYKKAFSQVLNEYFTLQAVPLNAAITLGTNIASPTAFFLDSGLGMMLDNKVGGNINEKESYEVKQQIWQFASRTIPGLNELPIRLMGQSILFNNKPTNLKVKPLGSDTYGRISEKTTQPTTVKPVVPAPTTGKPSTSPNIVKEATTPYKAPM